jgi:UDP-N-acetylmuramate: L-alanyl-gamma-D-glutamyl-meso-diaminopimelate ligase
MRAHVGSERIIAVLDPASNTMRSGAHSETLGGALAPADAALIYRPPSIEWDIGALADTSTSGTLRIFDEIDALVSAVCDLAATDGHVVIMSNSGFAGFHQRLLDALGAADR